MAAGPPHFATGETALLHTPTTEPLASELVERVHQLWRGADVFFVRHKDCTAILRVIAEAEWIRPFARWKAPSALKHGPTNVNITGFFNPTPSAKMHNHGWRSFTSVNIHFAGRARIKFEIRGMREMDESYAGAENSPLIVIACVPDLFCLILQRLETLDLLCALFVCRQWRMFLETFFFVRNPHRRPQRRVCDFVSSVARLAWALDTFKHKPTPRCLTELAASGGHLPALQLLCERSMLEAAAVCLPAFRGGYQDVLAWATEAEIAARAWFVSLVGYFAANSDTFQGSYLVDIIEGFYLPAAAAKTSNTRFTPIALRALARYWRDVGGADCTRVPGAKNQEEALKKDMGAGFPFGPAGPKKFTKELFGWLLLSWLASQDVSVKRLTFFVLAKLIVDPLGFDPELCDLFQKGAQSAGLENDPDVRSFLDRASRFYDSNVRF